ncbi:MAG: HEAT repeat domain-containing protein [Nitrospinales bacterium]
MKFIFYKDKKLKLIRGKFELALMIIILTIVFASLGFSQHSEIKTADTVIKIRERCLAILEKAFVSEDAFIRSAAVRAAGESEDISLLPMLKKGSKDFYSTARLFALQGIKKISPDEALNLAKYLLADKNGWVKSAALAEIGNSQNKKTIPIVEPFLEDTDPMIRLAAAFALYKLGEASYLSKITDSLTAGDVVSRYQAISYLGEIGSDEAIEHLVNLFDDERGEVIAFSLKAIGINTKIEMLSKLKKLVISQNLSVRHNALMLLGYLPASASLETVKKYCEDEDAFVRLSVAISLHRLNSRACKGIFNNLLGDKDFAVRSSAARILGEIPIADRMKLLSESLGDPNSRVRTAAVRAVGMAGGAEAFYLLVQMLDDSKEAIRAYAAGNLLNLLNK